MGRKKLLVTLAGSIFFCFLLLCAITAVFSEEKLPVPPAKPAHPVIWVEGENATLTNIKDGHPGWDREVVEDKSCYNGKTLYLYLGGEIDSDGYYAYYDVNVPVDGDYEFFIASSVPDWAASSLYYYVIDEGDWVSSEGMSALSDKWGPCGLVAWTKTLQPLNLSAGQHQIKFKVTQKATLQQPPTAFIWVLDAFCLVKLPSP